MMESRRRSIGSYDSRSQIRSAPSSWHRRPACVSTTTRDSCTPMHDRRSFLKAVWHAGLAATSLRSGAALLGPAGTLLQSRRADAEGREPLIQPPEIRSQNGALNATITAAPGRVRVGEYSFPGLLY